MATNGLNIVVPMAGLGSRFADAGYTAPKPFLPVRGRPMYAWAVDSLPLGRARRLVFVLLESQPEYPALRDDILRRYADAAPVVLSVPHPTTGQSASVLRARDLIDGDDALLIHNADTAFTVDAAWVDEARDTGCDGALLVFPSDERRWSYSRADADGWVREVREKVVISPWASTGSYWFRRGSDFVRLAEARIAENRREAAEHYVAPLYNDLIAEGGRVRNFPVDDVLCFGTPEEYERALEVLGG